MRRVTLACGRIRDESQDTGMVTTSRQVPANESGDNSEEDWRVEVGEGNGWEGGIVAGKMAAAMDHPVACHAGEAGRGDDHDIAGSWPAGSGVDQYEIAFMKGGIHQISGYSQHDGGPPACSGVKDVVRGIRSREVVTPAFGWDLLVIRELHGPGRPRVDGDARNASAVGARGGLTERALGGRAFVELPDGNTQRGGKHCLRSRARPVTARFNPANRLARESRPIRQLLLG